jgi:hypothetical protein
MAIVVETGAGLSTAETYISVNDCDAYHLARANSAWAALSTPNKEAFLRRATEYMLQMYRLRWKGVRMTATQALDWPRAYVYTEPFLHGAVGEFPYLVANDIVPVEVARACAELALRAIDGDLAPDLEVPVTSEQVGPIAVTYAEGGRQTVTYRAIDAMLSPLLEASGGMIKVSRA